MGHFEICHRRNVEDDGYRSQADFATNRSVIDENNHGINCLRRRRTSPSKTREDGFGDCRGGYERNRTTKGRIASH